MPYKPGDLDKIQPRPKFISDIFVQVGPDSALYVNTGAPLYRSGTPIFETDRFIQSVRPDRDGGRRGATGAASDGGVAIPALDGRRVLTVEDHETTRALLRQMVEEWGLVARAVGSGAEALTALDEAASLPALLLLDAQMEVPGESSLEVQLRARAGAPTLPLVWVNAAQRQSEATSDRHTVWVRKPVKRASL